MHIKIYMTHDIYIIHRYTNISYTNISTPAVCNIQIHIILKCIHLPHSYIAYSHILVNTQYTYTKHTVNSNIYTCRTRQSCPWRSSGRRQAQNHHIQPPCHAQPAHIHIASVTSVFVSSMYCGAYVFVCTHHISISTQYTAYISTYILV